MKLPQGKSRTWRCRAVDRLGLIDTPLSGGAKEDGERLEPQGMLARWARKHVESCDYCRAEISEWERTVAWLRQVDRPTAPTGLLDRVVADLAHQGTKDDERAEGFKRLWNPGDRWIGELYGSLVAAVYALSIAALALPQTLGLMHQVIGIAKAAAMLWRDGILEAFAVFDKASYALPAGAEPYAVGLLWSTVGVILSGLIMRLSDRRPVISSDWEVTE